MGQATDAVRFTSAPRERWRARFAARSRRDDADSMLASALGPLAWLAATGIAMGVCESVSEPWNWAWAAVPLVWLMTGAVAIARQIGWTRLLLGSALLASFLATVLVIESTWPWLHLPLVVGIFVLGTVWGYVQRRRRARSESQPEGKTS